MFIQNLSFPFEILFLVSYSNSCLCEATLFSSSETFVENLCGNLDCSVLFTFILHSVDMFGLVFGPWRLSVASHWPSDIRNPLQELSQNIQITQKKTSAHNYRKQSKYVGEPSKVICEPFSFSLWFMSTLPLGTWFLVREFGVYHECVSSWLGYAEIAIHFV